MNWLLTKTAAFTAWIVSGLPGDLRSAAVGALFAAVVTWGLNWYNNPGPPLEVEIPTDGEGFASPIAPLLGAVSADAVPTSFTFDPPAFKDVWVCEYSYHTGYSGREMMLAFLSKYSMCFAVVQSAKGAYTIRPNPNESAEFKQRSNGWFCRCK